jgi:hypothetical protein
LASKLEGEGAFAKYKYRGECNIKMDFKGIKYYDVECILLTENKDRWLDLWNTAMSLLAYKRRRISELLAESQGLAPSRYVAG